MPSPEGGQGNATAITRAPVPVILIAPDRAEAAFAAYSALAKAEALEPTLRGNPYWQPLRDSAFARFRAAFEVMPGGAVE